MAHNYTGISKYFHKNISSCMCSCKIMMYAKNRFLLTGLYFIIFPLDTGRKLNVHKTSRTSSERLMYVQFMSYVQEVTRFFYMSNVFYKQKLGNTLRLNFTQTCRKHKFVCVNEIIWRIVTKMKLIMEKYIT